MKKVAILLSIASLALLASCDKEQTKEDTVNNTGTEVEVVSGNVEVTDSGSVEIASGEVEVTEGEVSDTL